MSVKGGRHPATADAWHWLELRSGDDVARERIAEILKRLDADLHALDAATEPRCTGFCIGTGSAETLVEDLTCPVHGIKAQEIAKRKYTDRQAWLDALKVKA